MLVNCSKPSKAPPTKEHESPVVIQKPPHVLLDLVKSSGAGGSAYLEFNGSIVLCTVYEPKSATTSKAIRGVRNLNRGIVECEVNFASHISACESNQRVFTPAVACIEKQLSSDLSSIVQSMILLDNYPKSCIPITVIILQSSLQNLSAIVNAATLALVNAKVELSGLASCYSVLIPAVVSVNTLASENDGIVDQIHSSQLDGHQEFATFTCCQLCRDEEAVLSFVRSEGRLISGDMQKAMSSALAGCCAVKRWMAEVLRNSFVAEPLH